MRYHRVSPDYLPLSNGRKPTLRTCKEDDADHIPNYSTSTLESRALRLRSATATPSHDTPSIPHDSPSSDAPPTTAPKSHPRQEIANGGGDILLQWGHNKRTRGSRAEGRGAAAGDESSGQSRSMAKVPRRGGVLSAAVMLPPPCGSYHRGANLRPCTPSRDASSPLLSRNAEERSGIHGHGHGHHRSEKRSPPSPSLDAHKLGSGVVPNGCGLNLEPKPAADHETQQQQQQQQQQEKLNLEQFEWPKIYIALSRKEKEDDFLAMKGTKLPQRPKKRAKNIDRTLQYCFPGMWLSDLTRGRYEVREKKCVKKKRRGLKGMESMDSDSE